MNWKNQKQLNNKFMNVKYYDIVLIIVQVILTIAHFNTSDFAEALILIAQAILLFMQCSMRPNGCDNK
jgi:hypothetical protein